ncbi:MAG: hypothetical protein ACI9BO_001516 [Zhongshania sp.]|jgi:hypothetical protein
MLDPIDLFDVTGFDKAIVNILVFQPHTLVGAIFRKHISLGDYIERCKNIFILFRARNRSSFGFAAD